MHHFDTPSIPRTGNVACAGDCLFLWRCMSAGVRLGRIDSWPFSRCCGSRLPGLNQYAMFCLTKGYLLQGKR